MSLRFNWRQSQRIAPVDEDAAKEVALYIDDAGNIVIRKMHWARQNERDEFVYLRREHAAATARAILALALEAEEAGPHV